METLNGQCNGQDVCISIAPLQVNPDLCDGFILKQAELLALNEVCASSS